MKTRFLITGGALLLGFSVTAPAAWQPGLQGGTVAGTTINKTAMPAATNIYMSPQVGATQAKPPWADYTTWIYWGQVYLGKTNTWFAENIDDAVYMRIWNGATPTVLLDNNVWNTPTAGSFTAPAAGWYPVEIRMWNGGVGAGPVPDPSGWTTTKGFGYKIGGASSVNGADYTFPQDNGFMSLFRHDDGLGFDETLMITGYPGNYGVVSPLYGATNGLETGDSFLCSAPTGTLVVATGRRASCAGYQIYTNDTVLAASGTTNAFTYTHDLHARLVWQWAMAYEMAFTAETGGTLSTPGGWYAEGSNVTVTATPDPGATFAYWTGNVPAAQRYQATLSFPSAEPVTAAAVFQQIIYVRTDGSDSSNGLSWAGAKQTIQAAVAAAGKMGLVLVSNGVYAVTKQIAITNSVQVRSVNGASQTFIHRGSGDYRLVLLKHAEAVVDGFTIAKGTSGGVYIDAAGTLINCVVRDNVGNLNLVFTGGGVYLNLGGLVKNCRIINNSVNYSGGNGGSGGGAYLNAGGTLDSCIISNNVATYGGGMGYGGGVYMTGGSRIRNCLIARNSHIYSTSGVYCNGGTVESCTIVDNHCPTVTGVGGLYNSNGTILNTIIAYNNNKNGLSNRLNAGTTWSYTYSCTTPSVAGIGNTALEQQFSNRAAQDYSLLPGPGIDTGANQDWMDGALDAVGGARLVSGTVDMGALEAVPGALRCSFEGTPLTGLASNRVVFTAYAGGTNTTGLSYYWSFQNDATTDMAGSGRAVVTNLYWPGLYSVRLTVSNAVGEADTQVREQYIKVAPVVAYVTTDGPSIYPYDTWAKAATNLHDAVAASLDGTLVRVSNGVYRINRQIELLHNIAVRSVNGAGATEIRRQSGNTRIFYLTRPEAVVDGFTLVNANLGAVYLDGAGVVSNCIIRDNISENLTTSGGGVRLQGGGHVKNCRIFNNYLNTSGGGGADGGGIAVYSAGLVENCVISNNTVSYGSGGAGGGVYMSGGRMRNSLIFDNRHIANAGGVYCSGGTVENCTIVSNRCGKAAATSPGGLQCANGIIRNTIIHDNWSVSNLFNTANSGTTTYNHCSTWPTNGLVGSGNQDRDPLFRNPAIGDCRLGRGSPCINAGLYQTWMDGAFDVAGQPRILNKFVDIGAYENPLPGGTLMILR